MTVTDQKVLDDLQQHLKRSGLTHENFRLPNAVKDKLLAIIQFGSVNKRIKLESVGASVQVVQLLENSKSTANSEIPVETLEASFREIPQSSQDKEDPASHLIPNWQLKAKEAFMLRVPDTVNINGQKIKSSECEVSITFSEGKYIATCPICKAPRAITTKANPQKFLSTNLLRHFASHSSPEEESNGSEEIIQGNHQNLAAANGSGTLQRYKVKKF